MGWREIFEPGTYGSPQFYCSRLSIGRSMFAGESATAYFAVGVSPSGGLETALALRSFLETGVRMRVCLTHCALLAAMSTRGCLWVPASTAASRKWRGATPLRELKW